MYFDILPTDLQLNLSLYLNYPSTLQYCLAIKRFCNNDPKTTESNIWKYKIKNELHEIIDTTWQTPLNLKYIELKSRFWVDFGSEYYLTDNEFINRAALLPNIGERHELLDYFSIYLPHQKHVLKI